MADDSRMLDRVLGGGFYPVRSGAHPGELAGYSPGFPGKERRHLMPMQPAKSESLTCPTCPTCCSLLTRKIW